MEARFKIVKEKFKQFTTWCNEKGIPMPMVRYKGKASMRATLVVISTFFVMFGVLNGIADIFKGVDMQSILYWTGMCYALFFGKKIEGDGKSLTISSEKKEE